MRSIASSSAAPRSPTARRGPPIPATASQKLPAPRPSSKRPPLMTSSDAAALASIVGGGLRGAGQAGRVGEHRRRADRQAGDIGEEAQPIGPSEQVGDEAERVEETPLIRVVLDSDEVEPAALGGQHLLDNLRVRLGIRRRRDTEFEPSAVSHRRDSPPFNVSLLQTP